MASRARRFGDRPGIRTALHKRVNRKRTPKKKWIICKFRKTMKDIILALITRALFAAHGLIGIWRAQTEWDLVALWLLLIPIGLLVLEALFTVGIRGGEEYKWISPCVLLYLCGIVPSIWFLELNNFNIRQERHYCNDQFWGLLKEPGCDATFFSQTYDDLDVMLANRTRLQSACELEYDFRIVAEERRLNQSLFSTAAATVTGTMPEEQSTVASDFELDGLGGDVVDSIENAKKVLDNLLGGVNIFDQTTWVLVLHQLLLFILIIGRWLLPTGDGISRDELSQLLLVFIGVGADILEFVTETVKELAVRCDRVLIILIMAFWSWSTLQFTLVLTAAKSRRTRAVGIYEEEQTSSRVNSPVVVVEDANEEPQRGKCYEFWSNTEVWGIMSTLILQDGPFLAMRLYIMVGRKVVHQMIVFFTCKNCLVVILQLYRLAIIATKKDPEEEEEDEYVPTKMDAVNTVALAKSKFKGLRKRAVEDSSTNVAGDTTTPSKNAKDIPDV